MNKHSNDPRRPLIQPPSYPWMQRPAPGQIMPSFPGYMPSPTPYSPTSPMDPFLPMDPFTPWIMPQWNRQMWEPSAKEDPWEMQDSQYWQQLYPEQTRRIQREVSHQCDLLDYEGSVLYDDYPDRIALARICESVYHALTPKEMTGDPTGEPSDSTEITQTRQPNQRPSRWLQDLIEVLLYQEMHERRRHRRQQRRWW